MEIVLSKLSSATSLFIIGVDKSENLISSGICIIGIFKSLDNFKTELLIFLINLVFIARPEAFLLERLTINSSILLGSSFIEYPVVIKSTPSDSQSVISGISIELMEVTKLSIPLSPLINLHLLNSFIKSISLIEISIISPPYSKFYYFDILMSKVLCAYCTKKAKVIGIFSQ